MVIINHRTAQGMNELEDMTAAEINKYLGDGEVKIALHAGGVSNVAVAFQGDWRIHDCKGYLWYYGVPECEPLSTVRIVEKAYENGIKHGHNIGHAAGKRAVQKEIMQAMGV